VRLEGVDRDVKFSDGIYYSLPKTLVRVTIQVETTHFEPGPQYACAEAASVSVPVQFVVNNGFYQPTDRFNLGKIDVSELAIPDPDNVFLIEIQDLWTETREHLVTLGEAGLIISGKSVGHDRTLEYAVKTIEAAAKIAGARYGMPVAPKSLIGDIFVKPIDPCDVAGRLGKEIIAVRNSRRELAGTINLETDPAILDRQLKDLDIQEKGLLANFFTWEATEETWTFEVEPQDGQMLEICTFSKKDGIVPKKPYGPTNLNPPNHSYAKNGEKISIAFEKRPATQYSDRVGTQSNRGKMDRRRSFFYRVPALAKAWIYRSGKIVLERDMLVNQFGRVAALPDHAGSVQSQLKVEYHNDYGSPKSVAWTTTAPDPANIETIGNAVSEAVAARAAQSANEPSAIDRLNEQLGVIERAMGILGGAGGGSDDEGGDDGG
jgi:hypothetical protein